MNLDRVQKEEEDSEILSTSFNEAFSDLQVLYIHYFLIFALKHIGCGYSFELSHCHTIFHEKKYHLYKRKNHSLLHIHVHVVVLA